MVSEIYLYPFFMLLSIITTCVIPKSTYQKYSQRRVPYYLYALLPILIFTIIWGLRFNVGTDYMNYVYIVETESLNLISKERGFVFFVSLLRSLNLGATFFFFFTCLVTIFSQYVFSRRFDRTFSIFLIFFFYTTCSCFSSLNGIRQSLALAIFVGSIPLFFEKRYLLWIFASLFAFCFHQSYIILIIAFLILVFGKKPIFLNKYIVLAIYLTSVFIGFTFQGVFVQAISTDLELFGYGRYIERAENAIDYDTSALYGIGVVLTVLSTSLIILNQNSIFKEKEKTLNYYFYWFYIIGSIMMFVFAGNIFLGRINQYFYDSFYITLAYFCYRKILSNSLSDRIQAVVVCLIYFALFVANIMANNNGVVPYQNLLNI